jgi:hypothetical protein
MRARAAPNDGDKQSLDCSQVGGRTSSRDRDATGLARLRISSASVKLAKPRCPPNLRRLSEITYFHTVSKINARRFSTPSMCFCALPVIPKWSPVIADA